MFKNMYLFLFLHFWLVKPFFFVFRIIQFIKTLLKRISIVDREVTCGQRTTYSIIL